VNIIDLFAGAGGLSEGFRRFSYNMLLHVEMDSNASDTLKTREVFYYLKSINRLDIYSDYLNHKINKSTLYGFVPSEILDKVLNVEISEQTIPFIFEKLDQKLNKSTLDGIVGGPPCQAFSLIGRVSNKSKKDNDKRIYLYEFYVDFLIYYKPRFFIFENVKGLKSFRDSNNNLLLPQIIEAFDNAGYYVEDNIIDSSEYGVPQVRERLFIYGYRKDLIKHNFFWLFSQQKEMPITLKELFEDLPILPNGLGINSYQTKHLNNFVKRNIRGDLLPLSQNICRKHNKRDLEIYKLVLHEKTRGKQLHYDNLPNELKTHKNTSSFTDRYKALDYHSLSHTIVAHISKDGHYYIHPDIEQNRSISVREAARIQTFPDSYYFEGSRSAMFRQIGNAVPPLLSEKIAYTIIRCMN
jgi:DNA (cytosine-5)-methyltransferase 1